MMSNMSPPPQPPYGYHPPQPPPGYPQPPQGFLYPPLFQTPQLVTNPARMSQAEKIVHAILIICTFGLWLPVYMSRKRSFKGRTITNVYQPRSARTR